MTQRREGYRGGRAQREVEWWKHQRFYRFQANRPNRSKYAPALCVRTYVRTYVRYENCPSHVPQNPQAYNLFFSILILNISVLLYCYMGYPHTLPPPQVLIPILFSPFPWSATCRRRIGERCDHSFIITYDLDIILFTLTFRFIYYIILLFHGIQPFS